MAVGSGTILVAEDSEEVQKLMSEVLREEGYQVLVAQNGEEALRLVEDHPGPIHLLLTDVVMPGVGGKEVADLMASLRPETKVLYTSGYTNQAVCLTAGMRGPGTAYLQKPFSPDDLIRRVRDVLAAKC
jgi:CheY-like chemotaxis protein